MMNISMSTCFNRAYLTTWYLTPCTTNSGIKIAGHELSKEYSAMVGLAIKGKEDKKLKLFRLLQSVWLLLAKELAVTTQWVLAEVMGRFHVLCP